VSRPPRATDSELVRRAALRLGLQAAIGTGLVVALLAAVAVVVLVRSRSAADDILLSDTVARADDVEDPPSGTWLVIRTAAGTQATPGLPAELPLTGALDRVSAGGSAELTDVTLAGQDFRVRTAPRDIPDMGPATVQAVLSLRVGQQQLAVLLQALLVGGVVGLAVAAAAGSWLGRRAVRPLESALALQRRFVADASHELRTPLTLLSTRAQLLRRHVGRDAGPERVRADVDGLVADTERLTAILDDLLLAADPRSAAADERVDMAACAGEVVAAAGPAAESTHIAISLVGDTGAAVSGSPAGLRRAITALVDNALRHATDRVTVTVVGADATVVVEVSDDGPGIAPELLPHVFERFASAGDGPGIGTRRYGLGLALVREIVTRHGGSVSAVDALGRGATVRLELPRAPGV
jgi:two-component system, OmpR family, sensor kinase